MGSALSTCGKASVGVTEDIKTPSGSISPLWSVSEAHKLQKQVTKLAEHKNRSLKKLSQASYRGLHIATDEAESIEHIPLAGEHPETAKWEEVNAINDLMNTNPVCLADMWENRPLEQLPGVRLENMFITALELTSTSLVTIPPSIKALKSLQILILSHNNLQTVPQEIEDLCNLTTLYLDSNCIHKFPEAVCKLRTLEVLWMQRNQLRELPTSITHMPFLKQLLLHSNQIEALPEEVKNMRSLTSIWIFNNQIREIPTWSAQVKGSKIIHWERPKVLNQIPST